MITIRLYTVIWFQVFLYNINNFQTDLFNLPCGWICHVIPIKVGCRGFLENSVISFLLKIGITGCTLKAASNHLQTAVRYASSWIWSKARSFQHE